MTWKKIKEKAQDMGTGILAATGSINYDLSTLLSKTDWFKDLNKFSSEISKSMDAEFLKQGIHKSMTPNNHRIMDGGHDFFTTIEKAQEIGDANGWSSAQTFEEWAKAYFTDLSSSAGMPVFGKITDEIYVLLKSMGLSEANARDLVTVNGQEAVEALVGGGIAATALIFSWKKEDKDSFSRVVGSIVCAGAVTMNPASLLVAVMALAFGYNKLVCKEAIARGAIVTSLGLTVSALIPGPVLLGAIPAFVLSVYVNKKMGKEFKPVEYSKSIITFLQSSSFRKTCTELIEELKGKDIKKKAA